MANQALIPQPQGFFEEAPLNFLREAEQSVWTSLFANLREALFPEKLPPLELTSTPVPVPEIWSRKKPGRAAAGSVTLHALAIGGILGITLWAGHTATALKPTIHTGLVTPLMTDYVPNTVRSSAIAGGGAHDKLPETKGRLPKITKEQFTPPTVIIRNLQPKLAMEQSIVAPPDLKMPNTNLPNIGNPTSSATGPLSNGTGSGGGIGSGSGGNIGNGMYRMGQPGVTAPILTFSPDPDWSDEARRNRHEGTVVLRLIVGANGRPHSLRVLRSLGMGLDEKALEKVKTWLFEPGKKDGQPVAVLLDVEVAFGLH